MTASEKKHEFQAGEETFKLPIKILDNENVVYFLTIFYLEEIHISYYNTSGSSDFYKNSIYLESFTSKEEAIKSAHKWVKQNTK